MDENSQKTICYGAVNWMKACASICIILMHVLANGQYAVPENGVSGFIFAQLIPSFTNFVFLFMVISAFGMCCGYYERMTRGEVGLSDFYGRRYQKIWPFFALLCVLDIAISPGKAALYEFLADLTLCFGLLPNANIRVIGVRWFIGVVFVFYMLFPFFCYLLSTKKKAWISFGGALLLNILCTNYFFDSNHVHESFAARTNIVYCAMFFFAGGLIYLYRNELAGTCKRYKWITIAACAIAVVFYYGVNRSVYTMLVLFSLMMICGIGMDGQANKIIVYMSSISMEVYLCHMVVYRAIEKARLLHVFSSGVLSYVTASVLTIGGAVLFAELAKKATARLEGVFRRAKR